MQNDIFENWAKFNQQSLDTFRKLGEANLKIGEKLLQEQVELTNSLVESATRNAEQLSKCKDYSEAAGKQAEIVQDYSKQVLNSARTCADLISEAGKTYNQLFEQHLKAAGETAEKSAKRKAA